jgi:hypothetical protein
MKSCTIPLIILALPFCAHAHWPTTLRENLPVAANPDYGEAYPTALPYPNGGTMVVYNRNTPPQGACYQIIDRFGDLVFDPAPLIAPTVSPYIYDAPLAISDGAGGAFIACLTYGGGYNGLYAQRLDSLGNRLWGDAGVQIFNWHEYDYDVCIDAQGGFFAAMSVSNFPDPGDIRVQRLDAEGQTQWGDSGVVVCPNTHSGGEAKLAPDGLGGVYAVFYDLRPPYQPYGALFRQRFDGSGNALWQPDGIYVCPGIIYVQEVIPDGENGLLLLAGGLSALTVYRFAPDGSQIWSRPEVSWGLNAKIVAGPPGYFHLGFSYGGLANSSVYGQKMDLQGNTYWPTPGSYTGALMMTRPYWTQGWHTFAFWDDCFYGGCNFVQYPRNFPRLFNVQILDSTGSRRFGERGVTLTLTTGQEPTYAMQRKTVVPDRRGGIVAVWEASNGGNLWDVYAKHVNPDGTLGGPAPPSYEEPRAARIQSVSPGLVKYELTTSGEMSLELFDLLGRKVALLEQAYKPAGDYVLRLDLPALPAGIYFLRLKTPGAAQVAKLAIIK